MSRIFISYKRADKEKVFAIKDKIEAATGEKCWIDLDGIESSEQFEFVIINAIDNADVFLFMYSKGHTQITDLNNDWTIKEIRYAEATSKRIVFINLDHSLLAKWFLFNFSGKQQIDATSESALNRLIDDIKEWLCISDTNNESEDISKESIDTIDENQDPEIVVNYTEGLEYKYDDDTLEATLIGIGAASPSNIAIPPHVAYKEKEYRVTQIEANAFYNCALLSSVKIGDCISKIGDCAFGWCENLKAIEISKSVHQISDSAFSGCPSLSSIIVSKENPVYDSRNDCNAIIESQSNRLIHGCDNSIIPNGIERIEDQAFDGCQNLKTVTIPRSVVQIGEGAFINCSSLSSIIVEKENPIYDSRNNCNAIIETKSNILIVGCKNTIIPSDIAKIGDHAFIGNEGLSFISIPTNVKSIGFQAFCDCVNLSKVNLANGLIEIRDSAFYRTGISAINIPDSVEKIDSDAFSFCPNLTSIKVSSGNKIYDDHNDCNVIVKTRWNALVKACNGSIIPSNISSIEDDAFKGCDKITSIMIPEGVTCIGRAAFMGCSKLAYVGIPKSVQTIRDYAFAGCDSLSSITIPRSVTYVGEEAFPDSCKVIRPSLGYSFLQSLREITDRNLR